ncbi:MAG: hypothetical protein GY811_10710 [Myxococcales bacterium]|nr:hypothetical protein [Myxococcales bacterium]
MSLRLGLVDVCAILVLLVVLFMPEQGMSIIGAYDHRGKGDKARDVQYELATAGRLQTALWVDPGNGVLAEEYAAIMSDLGRHDMALRIGGAASQIESPTTWKSLSAVSSAFADRIDIPNAAAWAEKAMVSCESTGDAACPAHEKVRLRLYLEQLRLGVEVLKTGADPKFDPNGFRRELTGAHRTSRRGKSN